MTDNWKQVQDDLRAGVYGDWNEIRNRIAEARAILAPDDGISSSDFNHIAYGMVQSGALTVIDPYAKCCERICNGTCARRAGSSDRRRTELREFSDGWSIEAADPNFND